MRASLWVRGVIMDKTQIELQARNLCRDYIGKGFTEIIFHTYRDLSGKILYWRIRMVNPKTGEKVIRPMSIQSGVFVLSEPVFEDQKPLYGLECLKESNTVFFVEGESCVDALHSLGLIATTSGGSSSFSSADFEPLRNKTVFLWADNDDPGTKFMDSVSSHLNNIGCQVNMLNIKGLNLPKGGDVVDWLKANPNATSQTILGMPYWQGMSGGEGTSSKEWVWEDPTPILEDFQNEPYPKEYLPQIIKDSVDEVAAFVQSPYSMLASSAISAISLACQALFDVQRSEKLKGPCSSYFLTIAESGERKSTGEGFFTESIKEYERNQADMAKPFIKEFKAQLDSWEAKCAGTKDKIRQLAKEGKETGSFEQQLLELISEKPEQPKIARLIYTDATPEALAFSLFSNWPSGGLISAEGGQVFGSHGMSSSSIMRNLAMLNQLWDGNSLHIDRRTSDSVSVVGARLTISIQIQEPALREFLSGSGELARGTGFLARFLVVWPESTQGNRPFVEAPKKWPKLSLFNQRLSQILNMPCKFDEYGALKPSLLNFSADAKLAWIEYHNHIENLLRLGGQLSDVRDVASKSADNAARIATLFEVFQNPTSTIISKESFACAQAITAWHLSESVRFFGQFSMPPETLKMVQLDQWLINYCNQNKVLVILKSVVLQYGPGQLRKKNVLDPTLQDLASKYRIRVFNNGKTQCIEINPALLEAPHGTA